MKSFISMCEKICEVDRDEMKGIKNEEQYNAIGIIRASVQNELGELKSLICTAS